MQTNELKHISFYLEEIIDEIKKQKPEYINYILDDNEQEVENAN